MVRIGVYVCHCGLNIAGVVDVKSVAKYASSLQSVKVARDSKYLCSDTGQRTIKEDIKKHKLDRVVIASCSPRMHEETFRRAVREAGLNPYLMEMINIREQDSWCHTGEPEKATEKAKELVEIAVARAAYLEPLETGKVRATKSVLVLGGGIAGIQAALDMADTGLKVYLVEKAPSIGGRMAQLDKTFPTLDCSACILTPKMVDVAKHPNIELLTNTEVEGMEGFVGNFKVSVVKKPGYVDEDKCVGCELCTQACPVKVPDGFNENLSQKKAISVYSPQAVPKIATIDPDYCLRLKYKNDVCGKCLQSCEAKAIDFEQKPETISLEVGAIVMAVGSSMFDALLTPELGYGHYKNVITNLQFERLCNAGGPTEGRILNPTTGKPPESIAFIQCVGSRDKRFCEYCCRVGCMITIKQAILVKEKMGDDVDVYVCYNDMRAFGKAYEEFFNRARRMGVKFVKGLPSEVKAIDGSLHFDVYESTTSKLLEIQADLVVLASGLVPSPDYVQLQSILRIPRSPDGFFLEVHPKLRPLETPTRGIFLAGVCQSPKDIPDTVSQASGAAMRAVALLTSGEVEIEPLTATVDEDSCSGCKICESICPYQAIEMETKTTKNEERSIARVLEAVCQGCGACAVACPTHAIDMKHYRQEQILAQIRAATYGGKKG